MVIIGKLHANGLPAHEVHVVLPRSVFNGETPRRGCLFDRKKNRMHGGRVEVALAGPVFIDAHRVKTHPKVVTLSDRGCLVLQRKSGP